MADNKVIFRNNGELDIRGITTFGVSAKGDNKSPIGKFGTGLKYAIAVCLRHNQKMTMQIGRSLYEFGTRVEEMRGKTYHQVVMYITVTDDNGHTVSDTMDLPFTTDLGLNWELWMAFRELYSNTVDEHGTVYPEADSTPSIIVPGETVITVEGDEFVKILIEKADVFLSTAPVMKLDEIDVHEGSTRTVFNKGIRVAEFEKPLMHRYDITGHAYLTEDRTLAMPYMFDRQITAAVGKSDDKAFITKMVTAPPDFHEASINYDNVSSPSPTFMATLKALIKKHKDRVNPTAIRLYETLVRKTRAVRRQRMTEFTIKLDIPPNATVRNAAEFIENALSSAKGAAYFDDPMRNLDMDSVTINHPDIDEENLPY